MLDSSFFGHVSCIGVVYTCLTCFMSRILTEVVSAKGVADQSQWSHVISFCQVNVSLLDMAEAWSEAV